MKHTEGFDWYAKVILKKNTPRPRTSSYCNWSLSYKSFSCRSTLYCSITFPVVNFTLWRFPLILILNWQIDIQNRLEWICCKFDREERFQIFRQSYKPGTAVYTRSMINFLNMPNKNMYSKTLQNIPTSRILVYYTTCNMLVGNTAFSTFFSGPLYDVIVATSACSEVYVRKTFSFCAAREAASSWFPNSLQAKEDLAVTSQNKTQIFMTSPTLHVWKVSLLGD